MFGDSIDVFSHAIEEGLVLCLLGEHHCFQLVHWFSDGIDGFFLVVVVDLVLDLLDFCWKLLYLLLEVYLELVYSLLANFLTFSFFKLLLFIVSDKVSNFFVELLDRLCCGLVLSIHDYGQVFDLLLYLICFGDALIILLAFFFCFSLWLLGKLFVDLLYLVCQDFVLLLELSL